MKTKYNKWISVFLAVLMLFTSVPINTFSINGQTSSEVSSENSTEISSEESTSSEIISSESEISSTESSEIISSEEDLSTENISSENTSTEPIADENAIAQIDVDGDDLEGTDNWELDVVFYDSTVDGGNTPLTEINWDGNVDTNNRIIKVQINYKNTNVVTSYDVGELAIAVPNLIYKNGNYEGTMYNANLSATAIVGANDSTHTGYAWDFASGISASTSQKEYIFTNAIPIEENANLEGSIQIEYTLKLDHRTEKYEDSCTSSYNTTLKAVLRETCPRSTTPDISSSDFNLSYYSTVYLEYSDPDPDTTQLKIRFSEYSYLFEFHKFKIYDEAGNVVYELKGVLGDSQYVTNMAGKTFVIDGNYLKIEFTPAGSGNMYDPYSFSIYVNENPEKRVIAESNEISFSYTKSYIHPWEQREYTITKNAYKVASLDGFPKGDYYWVKYSFATYGYYGDSYPEIGISEIYMKDQLPEGCVVLDNDLEPIEWDNELYDIYDKDDNYYDGPSTNTIYLYVGYPKSIYNDTNNNLNITNHVDLYVKYNNEEECKLVDDSEVSINLADFEFTYEGDLYSINKSKFYNCHGKLYSHFLLKEDYVHNCEYNCGHIGTGLNWNIAATAIYTGSPMTVKFGDDLVYITDSSGNYRKLTDEEYWFDYVEIPTLKNKNDVTINENKYPYKLYVRYANEEEYTLHSTITSSTYPYLYFDSDKKVVAYYFQVEDMEESLVTSTTNRSASIHVKPKDNIADSGEIYNFAFIQVYFKDSEGNLVLQNETELNNYNTLITQETIAQYDLDTYGHYVQRDEAFGTYSDYFETNIDAKIDVSKSKYYTSPVQDAANECFYIEYEFETSLDGTQFNIVPEEYVSNPEIIREVYLSGSGTVKMLSGFKLYDLLPKGMEINSIEPELLDSIVAWTGSNPPEDHIFMADGTKPFSDSQDVKEFIQKYSTFNFIKNWNNTGRTKIEWIVDFSEEPIFILGTDVDIGFRMNTLVSYDSYIEYGGVWKNNAYLESFYADGTKIDYGSINDNGHIDYEASDINSNGIINEKLDHSSSEVTLNAVISTHQDVTTFIQTDKSTFTTGGVYASENSQYQYKLRVRTGVADVTNLIIYDNLEEAYGDKEYWKGEFLGTDTSYAESKGYNVKTWYSENPAAGPLYNENGTFNTDWKEYVNDIPLKYAQGLEVTFNSNFKTERTSDDYVSIYYKLNGTTYKLGQWGGTELAGQTIQIPTNDFYLYWHTDSSKSSYYGFSIDSITHKNIENTSTTTDTIPNYEFEEISGNIYPDSAFDSYTHGAYGDNVNKVWHYTYTGEKDIAQEFVEGTPKDKVKSLAFEYFDSEGNPAILPANSMTYVLINMKALSAGEDVIYAYNQCWTNWNALDTFDQPVDFITGINSNIVRVTTNYYFDLTVNKTWVDNNNELNLRPDSVDIILKLKGEEIDRKQITIDNLAVTFTDLLTSQMEYYTLEEEYLALYNASEFVFDDETNEYNITNTLKDNILTTINGTKTWENDTEEKRPESITIKLLQDGIQIASTTTTAEQNWEYSFENVVKYKPDGTYHKYTVEESPVNNYFTSYGYSGVILKFNASSKTENEKYDYVEIFYDLYGTTHSLGKIGGADIAGKTVEIPSTNFYLYWHTDGSNSKYYGFKIDSITPADINIPINATPIYSDSEKPWNNYTAENITTISSLDSAFGSYTHSNYGNNVNKVWYYTSNYKSNFDITNSKNATSISGIKTWENDTEDVRPESITIKLLQDGTEIATTTTSAEKNWEYLFNDVPEFRSDGSLYEYSVEEVPVDRYTTSYKSATNGLAITFNDQSLTEGANWDYVEIYYILDGITYKLGRWGGRTTSSAECLAGKTIEVPSNDFYLYWKTDSSSCGYYGFSIDSIEPISVEHSSTINTGTIPSYTVEEISGTTYPDSNYDGNHPHGNYGNSVNKVWHYTGEVTGAYNIVNTRNSINITGTKIWENDTDSDRPETITIKLLQDGIEIASTTTSADDNWQFEFNDIIQYREDGSEYVYTVKETPVDGYSIFYSTDGTYNITNIKNSTSITGTKSWKDDIEDERPESITIKLLLDGVEYATTTTTAEQNWEYSFNNIPIYREDNSAYSYSVQEEYVDGYYVTYSTDGSFDITNTKNTIHLSGNKTWKNDTEDQRPASITVRLLQDGVEVDSVITTAEDNWEYDFGEHPKYRHDGSLYVYSVQEDPVDRYIASYPNNYGLAVTFNQSTSTESVNYDYLEIYYVIDDITYCLGRYDGSTLAGKTLNIPSSDFYLYWRTDGSVSNYYGFTIDSITTIEDVENTGYEATLPSFDVTEVTGNNYPNSAFDENHPHGAYGDSVNKIWHYTGQSSGGLNIVNTRNSTSISGYKTWLGDKESQRPSYITIKLLQDGIEFKSTKTTAANNWEYSFIDIPEFRPNGTKYDYSVEEVKIRNYAPSYHYNHSGLKITFNPQSTSENVSYDYLEIYYILNNTTYKLGKWGGTDLSNLIVQVPTKDFYLYWHTDESSCEYYGFTIDSIEFTNIANIEGTIVESLPEFEIDQISGSSYPDSAFSDYTHGNYGDAVDKLWHYNFTGNIQLSTPTINAFNIVNTRLQPGDANYLPEEVTIKFEKLIYNHSNIEATAEDFDKMALNISDTYKFKITLTNIDLETVHQGILDSKTGLTFSNLSIGTYIISEADSNYFDLRNIIGNNLPEGIVLSEINGVYHLIITESITENTVVEIKVINVLESNRYFENETYKENLFLINKNELEHDIPQD